MKFNFTVDSAILGELGERLVESVHIALSELVKNAYDADATLVRVKIYYNKNSTSPVVEVSDNGIGMTLDEIRKYWMKIATTNKVRDDKSKIFGRPMSGAKGIGRFSCRRLGAKLKLITVAKEGSNKYRRTEIDFDWAQFKPGKDVTEITTIGKTSSTSTATTGTTLIISGGETDEWQQRGFDYFKRQLSIMVANHGKRHDPKKKEDPGFNVELYCPDFDGGLLTDFRDELYEAGWGTLTAEVGKDGTVSYTLKGMGVGTKTISFEAKYPSLKGSTLKIAIIPVGRANYRDKTLLANWNVKEFLDDWGGVQVRANGIRVYPYGDDDWLEIDKDRGRRLGQSKFSYLSTITSRLKAIHPTRYLLNMLSMKGYLGYVEIHFLKPFGVKANREGFVENQAFVELKEFTRFAIDWSTIYREFFIRKSKSDEADRASALFEEASGVKAGNRDIISVATDVLVAELKTAAHNYPKQEKERIDNLAFAAKDAINKSDVQKESELFQLRLIASTSTLLLIFSHEIKMLFGTLGASASSMQSIGKKIGGKDGERLKEIGGDILAHKERITELARLTALIGRSNKNSKPTKVALCDTFESAVRCFSLFTGKYRISIVNKIPENMVIGPILKAEILAVIINALSNSVKSVIAKGGDRKIHATAVKKDGKVIINILDNGVGLDSKSYEEVFIAFVTDPESKLYSKLEKKLNPEDDVLGTTGNGLGLGIIKEIVTSRGGSVRFKRPAGNWKTCLEISL